MNRGFKILNIDHVAIAVDNLKKSKIIFEDILGMSALNDELVNEEQVVVSKISSIDSKTRIELLEPTSKSSVINKFLKKRGQGIHHIALEVDNIDNAIKYLKNKNIKLVYEIPQTGAGNKLITFIHPTSSPGILIELSQKA